MFGDLFAPSLIGSLMEKSLKMQFFALHCRAVRTTLSGFLGGIISKAKLEN